MNLRGRELDNAPSDSTFDGSSGWQNQVLPKRRHPVPELICGSTSSFMWVELHKLNGANKRLQGSYLWQRPLRSVYLNVHLARTSQVKMDFFAVKSNF